MSEKVWPVNVLMELIHLLHCHHVSHIPSRPSPALSTRNFSISKSSVLNYQERPSLKLALLPLLSRPNTSNLRRPSTLTMVAASATGGVPQPPLDLTEDNVRQVLADARVEFGQVFDTSVGITGQAELAELDGPFVKISLKGRFWHKRSTVLARIGNYLRQRIPEILEVDIEDEKQLDDSPENF